MFSTKRSRIEIFANFIRLNRLFSEYSESKIDYSPNIIISPVDATVKHIGEIKNNKVISKSGREINLEDVLGSKKFDGFYLNLYLNPYNRHFWVTPYVVEFISTKLNNGEGIPLFLGLESFPFFRHRNIFERAIKKNASIGSVLMTKNFPIAMIAIGSLNVNGIHAIYDENYNYNKGEHCGYFSIGSTMLLCFPDYDLETLVKEKDKVKIGQPIIRIK
ncbi:phosphatidylserine decarboxylase [archaeon]|nr:phosphatidylserine decarboxylase [archaeon]